MIILQLITPAPLGDPLQRKMMAIGMPLFMLYVLWGAPSGLLLYWLVGTMWFCSAVCYQSLDAIRR